MFAPVAEEKKSPKTRPHNTGVYSQLKELQAILMDAAKSEEITPSALAQVTRAFTDAEEMKLRIRMKPAPKPVDVSTVGRKPSPTSASFTETPAQAKPKRAGKAPIVASDTTTASVPPNNSNV